MRNYDEDTKGTVLLDLLDEKLKTGSVIVAVKEASNDFDTFISNDARFNGVNVSYFFEDASMTTSAWMR